MSTCLYVAQEGRNRCCKNKRSLRPGPRMTRGPTPPSEILRPQEVERVGSGPSDKLTSSGVGETRVDRFRRDTSGSR